jgi:hypothetical protein
MKRQSVILAVLIVLLLLGGQTYAQTVMSIGKWFGSSHGSISLTFSVFDPTPVYCEPYVVAPPPAPVYVQPTYVPQPTYRPPVVVQTPVVVRPPVVVQMPVINPPPVVIQPPVVWNPPVVVRPGYAAPVYYPPRSGYTVYYRGQEMTRQGHWVYTPIRAWNGVITGYRRIYVND